MKLMIGLAQQIGIIIAVMICATGGTIGIAELIDHFANRKSSGEKQTK